MKGSKLLVIPMELFQREIYTGLYLGLSMVNKGYDVLICDQLNPILDNVKGGVVFHKDHATWSFNYVKKFKERDTRVVVHDTEGLIVIDQQRYINGRVSASVIDEVDVVLCWGKTQRNLINESGKSNKVHLAGDLRFDIARKRKQVCNEKTEIKNVLINTRFSYVNPIQKTDIIRTFTDLGYLKTKKDIEKFKQIVTNDELIFKEFIKAIKLLVKNGLNVIIRPHPAEDLATYESMFDERVKIDKTTSLGAQIDWADCVVHDGCTTAIEARAQGKIVLGLRPQLEGETYDQYANKFSNFNCISSEDLLTKIHEFKLGGNAQFIDVQSNIDDDIYNFYDDKPYFIDTLYQVVDNLTISDYQILNRINKTHLRSFIKKALCMTVKIFRLKFLYGSRLVDGVDKYEKKYGVLSLEQIKQFCLEIEERIIKEKPNYQIKQLNSKAFILKRN